MSGPEALLLAERQLHDVCLVGDLADAGCSIEFIREVTRLEFEVPIIALARNGEPAGAEALLRWQHPERGLISPADFIPLAEATGQIVELGEWVLRAVRDQIAAWRRAGLPPITVAVNLSASNSAAPAW